MATLCVVFSLTSQASTLAKLSNWLTILYKLPKKIKAKWDDVAILVLFL